MNNQTYGRNGQTNNSPAKESAHEQNSAPQHQEEKIQVNGFQQMVDMLRVADPEFRHSLLARLSRADAAMARKLELALRDN